jgi:hypothetical protein
VTFTPLGELGDPEGLCWSGALQIRTGAAKSAPAPVKYRDSVVGFLDPTDEQIGERPGNR